MFYGGDPPVRSGLVLPCAARCRAVILAASLKLAAKIAALQFSLAESGNVPDIQ